MLFCLKFKFQLLAVISYALISAAYTGTTGGPPRLICARQLQVDNRFRNALSSLLTGIAN